MPKVFLIALANTKSYEIIAVPVLHVRSEKQNTAVAYANIGTASCDITVTQHATHHLGSELPARVKCGLLWLQVGSTFS